jgi:hypothetical protein
MTRPELQALLRPHAADTAIRVLGTDLDSVLQWLVPGPGGRLPRWMKKPWARRLAVLPWEVVSAAEWGLAAE